MHKETEKEFDEFLDEDPKIDSGWTTRIEIDGLTDFIDKHFIDKRELEGIHWKNGGLGNTPSNDDIINYYVQTIEDILLQTKDREE